MRRISPHGILYYYSYRVTLNLVKLVPILILESALTPNGDPFKPLLLEKQMIERGEVVANVCLDAMLG
jgi:hypothetical protein